MTSPIGEKLRLARVARGWSLEELGEAANITRQFGHQVETGARPANEDMIRVFAEVLGVSPQFFHIHSTMPVMPEQCHFRKQQSTPLYLTSQVLARGTLLDALVGKLEGAARLPSVNFPQYPVKGNDDIEHAAELCRKHWGLGLAAPITNMMRVVENAGAVVTYFEGVSERVDAFSMDRPRPIIVRSSLKESLCRQRFDLAHECGHLVMHRGVATGDRVTEDQANRFASAFLLPRAGFANEFPAGTTVNWRVLYEMKLRWRVSVRAIIHRAYDLGLLSARQYRTANIHLVKTGQARSEKYDDSLPIEQPELFDGIISALQNKKPQSLRQIADQLGWDDGLFSFLTGQTLPPGAPVPRHDNVVPLSRPASRR